MDRRKRIVGVRMRHKRLLVKWRKIEAKEHVIIIMMMMMVEKDTVVVGADLEVRFLKEHVIIMMMIQAIGTVVEADLGVLFL